jgi:uncharacterized membrane protein
VLQLASNQFSPRVLRNFLRDRGSQAALGVFAATFAYSLMGLHSVRSVSMGSSARVPALTVWLALVFAGLCVLTFIYFLHHTAQSIRAVNVLARIGDETRERLAQLYHAWATSSRTARRSSRCGAPRGGSTRTPSARACRSTTSATCSKTSRSGCGSWSTSPSARSRPA